MRCKGERTKNKEKSFLIQYLYNNNEDIKYFKEYETFKAFFGPILLSTTGKLNATTRLLGTFYLQKLYINFATTKVTKIPYEIDVNKLDTNTTSTQMCLVVFIEITKISGGTPGRDTSLLSISILYMFNSQCGHLIRI